MTTKPTAKPTSKTARTTGKDGGPRGGADGKTRSATPGTVGAAGSPTTLNDLNTDPSNRRRHGERNLGMIAEGLKAVGAARSIVIDEHNTIHAGNGVVEAARKVGLTKVLTVDVDGDTIVAVRRTGLTAAEKRQLAMYDNRAGELAEWNVEQLREDQMNGLELKPFFFDKEVDALLRAKGDQAAGVAGEKSEFVIVVTCKNEDQQTELLERFMAEGLECRAVVS